MNEELTKLKRERDFIRAGIQSKQFVPRHDKLRLAALEAQIAWLEKEEAENEHHNS